MFKIMKKLLSAIFVLALAMPAFNACKENDDILPDVKSASLSVNTLSLYIGETKNVEAKFSPSKANTAQVQWISRDEKKATVRGGYITGVDAGTTWVVLAIVKDDAAPVLADSVNVTVNKHAVTSVTLDKETLNLITGKTDKLTATVEPDNASFPTPDWTSSDETVATVENGTVTAVKAGSAVITATADGISASCTVFVIDADDFDIATDACAGSKTIAGGDQASIEATSDNFLSYDAATQTVSWGENTTGANREASLELSSGSKIKVSQAAVKASSFKGTWNFRTQRFSNNTKVAAAAADVTFEITIGDALFGETLTDHDGKIYTNTLGVKGLYLDAVADATVVADGEGVKFGLLLDERKAQPVDNGNATYPFVCFIPECGTVWNTSSMTSPWNFVPKPISEKQNYQWLWFLVKENNTVLNYDSPNKQFLIGKDGTNGTTIIGITCAVAKNATPTADDIFGTYNVIYQANPGKNNAVGGFTITKK